jgi:hypothetical protein
MNNAEAKAMFRADAIAAGLPPDYDPNKIAFTLHDWLESVPVNPDDPLWREVWWLRIGKDSPPGDYADEFPFYTEGFLRLVDPPEDWEEYYARCADACRGVLVRQQLNGRTI